MAFLYTHTIHADVGLMQQGLLTIRDGSYRGKVQIQPEGREASLNIRDTSARAALVLKLKAYFEKVPGVAGVYTNKEAQELSIPLLASTDQAPDLYLVAKQGYALAEGAEGPIVRDVVPARGAHGYLNTNSDMEALFVIWGHMFVPE